MHSLQTLGWCEFFEKQWRQKQKPDLVRARIAEENRGLYRIASENDDAWADLRGKLRHEAASRAMLPAVGDWVLVEERDTRATIHFLFERCSKFSRKVAGKKVEEQILAANVDTVFIVTSLNREFNARRIERYLTLAWESGARPVVVLNKADLCENLPALRADAEEAAIGVRTIVTSIVTGEGIEELREVVRKGGTTALLGSSGVGKSSLINAILDREIQTTSETRDGDDKGRHTTTSRQLIVVPGGGVLLDTPGMRELQLWDASEGISRAFADIEDLAARCKFRDCSHKHEPGCAVREAM
ncbi:MAG: ribosome small subunit-dependent GTPase A, partial [Acidobacteria bacterium]|nr:ribosome small subunit-dependent GTPase A [Acidobacteriota bacterium]